MARVYRKNFAGRLTPPPEFIADTYVECNFAQPDSVEDPVDLIQVGVPIFPGSRNVPRRFIRCNLLNCDVPDGSLVEDCLTVIQDQEELLQDVQVRGQTVQRVRARRRVDRGRYVHNEDGTRTRESFPPPPPLPRPP
jgi:hypothetical protein